MCSYLLIGFWFTRPIAANACQKAFVTNRVGDFGLWFLRWWALVMDVETASLRVWNGCELEEGWLVNKGERWRVMVLGVDEEKVVIMMERKERREKRM